MENIDQINFENKRVVIRVDFNVLSDENFIIIDDTHMRAAMPIINKVLNDKGMVILMSHLGRPKKNPAPKFSIKPIIKHLEELLGRPVQFTDDCMKAVDQVDAMNPGEVLVLESSLKELNKILANYSDYYICEAFGTARRAHASMRLFADCFLMISLVFKVLLAVIGVFPGMSPIVSCIVDLGNIISLIIHLFGRH